MTASELEFHDRLEDDEDAIKYSVEKKELIYSVATRHGDFVMEEPADFAQNIFDFIDMLYDDDDLDGEDTDFQK